MSLKTRGEMYMRRFVFVSFLLLSMAGFVNAQDKPKAEVFGGYSILNSENDRTGHGWHGSVAANLNSWFGLVVDVSGHYDSEASSLVFGPNTFTSDLELSKHSFHIGPRFSYRGNEKVTPFAHLLLGGVREHREEVTSIGFFKTNDTSASTIVGGGLDVKLTEKLALRLVQADFVFIRNGFSEHNARVSTGLVFRF